MTRGLVRVAAVTAALLCVAITVAQGGEQDRLREGETVTETDAVFPRAGPVDEDGDPTIWAVRIVDAITGRAIPGAKVQVPFHWSGAVAPEDLHHDAVGVADDDGWVRIPFADLGNWRDYIVADAPGYAANEYCTPGEGDACALVPGTDVPIVLLDYLGRPVPHAVVALNLGCGHIPDQRTARTDERGGAVLRSILPSRQRDIWVLAPGAHRGTTMLSRVWRDGDAPVPIHASPGIVATGRVLNANGTPHLGAHVSVKHGQRPACYTDEEGRFRLTGLSRYAEIEVWYDTDDDRSVVWFTAPPEGVARTLTLGAATDGLPLSVRVVSPASEPLQRVFVVALRRSDGMTSRARTDAAGAAEFSLPAGHWEVFTDGGLTTWGSARVRVDLSPEKPQTVTLKPPRNPTVRVDASRVLGANVLTATRRELRKWKPEEIDGQDVPISADEPTKFLVHSTEWDERVLRRFGVPAGGTAEGEVLVLDWPASTQVSVRCVDADGAAVPARLRVVRDRSDVDVGFQKWEDKSAAAAVAVHETSLAGTLDWVVDTPGEEFAPATGTIRIDAAGGSVDLGEVRLRRAAGSALHVDLPPGLADRGGSVTVNTIGKSYVECARIDADGSTDLLLPFYGPATQLLVEVDQRNVLPHRFRPDGPPPWRVKFPTGSVRIKARSPEGAVLPAFTLIADGNVFHARSDRFESTFVRGFTAGPHELIVAAPGRLAKVHRLEMRDGDARTLTVVLRAR